MRSVTVSAIAGAAILLSLPAARAADMPAPMMYHAPAEDFGGWYLRGDIGMSNQKAKLHHPAFDETASYNHVFDSFGSAPIFGVGIGYQFNSWLRVDVTGEYRGGSNYSGFGYYSTGSDEYTGKKTEWVGMVNAYADLGTWWCVTPFVGVGVGFAYNTISNFIDINAVTGGAYYAEDNSKMNFAWALHAGLAYKVTPGLTIELAYRYLDLGSAATGPGRSYDGAITNGRPFEFNDLVSHDVKLGVRWALEPEPTPMPRPVQLPPLMRKG